MENWYILQTKASRERQVAVHLHQRGFSVYLPLIWASPVNPRAARERPYFPGYLFARLDFEAITVDVVRWCPGAKGLVEFCSEAVAVSDAFMAELQQRLERVRAVGGMAREGRRRAEFLPVNSGPFEGFEGMFNARLLGAERARILLACAQQAFVHDNLSKLQRPGAMAAELRLAPDPARKKPL
jgi:transcriptional antiterminator RfaH